MKKKLFFVFSFSFLLFSSQITISPAATHYNAPYQVTLSGNGTIYYTTDGSMPTLNSSSGVNTLQIPIDQNKEIKSFLVDGQGNTSSVISKKYYLGALADAAVYFKPPAGWAGSCAMIDMVNPNSINGGIVDTFWPGLAMTNTGCSGWYKITAKFENANLRFTNCSPFENFGGISTGIIPVGSTVYYDFTAGEISNPPSCLFLNTTESSKNNILVKIYPNPVSDFLTISTDKNFLSYEIIDITGKILSKHQFSSKEIPINKLAAGNYFIKLEDKSGDAVILKFIKK
ncbi:hypothetical protein M2347_004156 [Chryseobacterium sp. H1D6B]|uniref:T9SS type A sorting domain-containing protein n=1 Tax=Chryseobacterium sp. H1D6B TaxID=2940588 RepID=UPI0015CB51B8|nr:T9SS type A sorting domain-containing protein [Chryseobacterium sp. H1D6B]MDH6254429.1 hypothetical protein [Chryseobacterium sp. H1D6B]